MNKSYYVGFGFQTYKGIDPFAKASVPSLSADISRKSLTTLTIPSPKSPKTNPFSKPSPVHNPFMTIVESKDELWNTVARSSSTTEKLDSSATTTASVPPTTQPLPESSNPGPPCLATQEGTNRVYGKIYSISGTGALVTGEEDEECILQVRAKLFKLNQRKAHVESNDTDGCVSVDNVSSIVATASSDVSRDWVEVGVGPVRLLKPAQPAETCTTSVSKAPRLVMRRESKVGGAGSLSYLITICWLFHVLN